MALQTLPAVATTAVVLVAVSVDRKVIHLILAGNPGTQTGGGSYSQTGGGSCTGGTQCSGNTLHAVELHVVVLRLVLLLVGQVSFMAETGDLLLAVTDVMLVAVALVTTVVLGAVDLPTVEMVVGGSGYVGGHPSYPVSNANSYSLKRTGLHHQKQQVIVFIPLVLLKVAHITRM